MEPEFKIEWDGPRSRYHETRVRAHVSRRAQFLDDPSFPRGCSYLRVPLVSQDYEGPGIDCHWDDDRHVLVCYMDIEDGPLPEELEAVFSPNGDRPEDFLVTAFSVDRPRRLN
ncbi:hypothetical protein Q5Y75_01290 [Ruegeria sp. 2205SS24-7]|uniref:hypothetical protein n=1 Tax=Ruegeria discodermiae TaxID=3064389 RepID=UPI00274212F9|nr:hypothetical protein [Ruegeria sp. 2205SS24-7]MDP5215842.1 hypothetical protein [Ruegeria sp. 2205SS24-7]